MAGVSGQYNDGRSAATYAVRIDIEAELLAIRADEQTRIAEWPLAEIRLLDRDSRSGVVRLCREQGPERLTFQDDPLFAALRASVPNLARSPYGRIRLAPVLGWTAGIGVALVLTLAYGLPYFSTVMARVLPPGLEQRMGAWMADPVGDQLLLLSRGDTEHKYCAAPDGQKVLQHLADRLGREVNLGFPLHVRVLNSPTVNAVTLPGGQIIVLRGLIDFSENSDELAGVLAHEIAHADLHHPAQLMIEQGGTGFLIGLLFGDVVGASVLGGIAGAVYQAHFSQGAESAADARGLVLLDRAGINATAWADLFERLEQKEPSSFGVFDLIASHPPTPQRADLIRAHGERGGPALNASDWSALKAICE